MSFCGASHLTISNIQAILTLILSSVAMLGLLAGVGFAIWQYRLYKKLLVSEQAMRNKQDEIDAVEPNVQKRLTGTTATQGYYDRLTAKEQKPLLRNLERLREERNFIKDKLLFAKK